MRTASSLVLCALLLVVGKPVSAGGLRLWHFRSPEFPALARQAGQPGDVLVKITVARSGHVADISVVGSPEPVLAESARLAVSQWRFFADGSVRKGTVLFRYRFSETPRDRCYARTIVEVDIPRLELTITVNPPRVQADAAARLARSMGSPSWGLKSRATTSGVTATGPEYEGEAEGLELEYFVSPHYPNVARKVLQSGDVRVAFKVDNDGKVSDISTRAPHILLGEAAKETISKWRFARVSRPQRGIVFFHYGFSDQRRDCDARTVVVADLPHVWTITADAPPPNEGDVIPKPAAGRQDR